MFTCQILCQMGSLSHSGESEELSGIRILVTIDNLIYQSSTFQLSSLLFLKLPKQHYMSYKTSNVSYLTYIRCLYTIFINDFFGSKYVVHHQPALQDSHTMD
jgi:hypothetical protein